MASRWPPAPHKLAASIGAAKEYAVTDELFDYFSKGSKKFEPLDDDLDLPEVSPKRSPDAKGEAAKDQPAEATSSAKKEDLSLIHI